MSFNKCIKNELGKLSKHLVEKLNSDIIEKLQLNQWRNTNPVLKWFNNITDKSNCSFIQFDIKEFYPSITENILHQTFKFAKQHTNIDKNDLRIINHCRKSLLFSDNKTWKKKTTDSCFDVTIGILMEQNMWTSRTLHPVKTRRGTSKIKLWTIPRRWTSFIRKS